MATGRRFFWVGSYTQADAPALLAYDTGLQGLGLVPVGAPVYRTFGSNATAFAAYQTGVVTIVVTPGSLNISAWFIDPPDVTALKQLTASTFGLTGTYTVGDDMVPV